MCPSQLGSDSYLFSTPNLQSASEVIPANWKMGKGWGRGMSPDHNFLSSAFASLPPFLLSAPEERMLRLASGVLYNLGASDLGFLICQASSSPNIPLAINMHITAAFIMTLETLCSFLLSSPVTR